MYICGIHPDLYFIDKDNQNKMALLKSLRD